MEQLPSAKSLAKRLAQPELLDALQSDDRPDAATVYARVVELQLSQKKLEIEPLTELLITRSLRTELMAALLGVAPLRKAIGKTPRTLDAVLDACCADDAWEQLLAPIWNAYRRPTAEALVRTGKHEHAAWVVDHDLFDGLERESAARAWHALDDERREAVDEALMDKFWDSRKELNAALAAVAPVDQPADPVEVPASAGLDHLAREIVELWQPHLAGRRGSIVAVRPDDGQRTPHLLSDLDAADAVVVGLPEAVGCLVPANADDDDEHEGLVALLDARDEEQEALIELIDAAHDLCVLQALQKSAPNVVPHLAGHDEEPEGLDQAAQRWREACEDAGLSEVEARAWLLDEEEDWLTT